MGRRGVEGTNQSQYCKYEALCMWKNEQLEKELEMRVKRCNWIFSSKIIEISKKC